MMNNHFDSTGIKDNKAVTFINVAALLLYFLFQIIKFR